MLSAVFHPSDTIGTMTELNISLSLTSSASSPRIPLKINSKISAVELHDLVSSTTSIPKSSLKLIFRGRLIPCKEEEDDVVAKFKLEDGCVVHCMGKPSAATSDSTAGTASTAAATAGTNTTASPSIATFVAATSAITTTPSVGPAATTTAFITALQTLKSSCANDTSKYITALKTLQKVIENIGQNPTEEKYRKIKCSNAAFSKRLGGLPGGKQTLLKCGFDLVQDDGDGEASFVMQPSAEKWEQLQHAKTVVDVELDRVTKEQHRPPVQRQAQQPVGAFGGGLGNLGGGLPPVPPGMDMAMMENMLSDPNALSSMLSVCNNRFLFFIFGLFF